MLADTSAANLELKRMIDVGTFGIELHGETARLNVSEWVERSASEIEGARDLRAKKIKDGISSYNIDSNLVARSLLAALNRG